VAFTLYFDGHFHNLALNILLLEKTGAKNLFDLSDVDLF